MKSHFLKLLLQNNKSFHSIIMLLLILSALFSAYTWLQPTTITSDKLENDIQINTTYDYKATYSENILYPNGGTVEAGETLLKNIINSIPINIISTIYSQLSVQVEGTHEAKLTIQAGEFWKREFPLEEKQSFKDEGTEINIFKDEAGAYTINYNEVEDFIEEVEEEISIRPEFYSISVQPNVEGTVTYNGTTLPFQLQDPLTFQLYFEEIILASETQFSTPLPFTAESITTNTLNLFGVKMPITAIRISSSIVTLLFLLTFVFSKKKIAPTRMKKTSLQSENINSKYKKRLVPVIQPTNSNLESIVHLKSFKTVLHIADSKDLPIFYYSNPVDSSKLYFVIDEGYIYQFLLEENGTILLNRQTKQPANKKKESDSSYVLD